MRPGCHQPVCGSGSCGGHQRRIEALETELKIIEKEGDRGRNRDQETAGRENLEQERIRLESLQTRWEAEKALVADILDIQKPAQGDKAMADGETVEAPPEEAAEVDANKAAAPLMQAKAKRKQSRCCNG